MVQSDQCKANNAEAIQFHAPKLGVVEQLHTRYKSIKFHGNLKNECILLVDLTWNYPIASWLELYLPCINIIDYIHYDESISCYDNLLIVFKA